VEDSAGILDEHGERVPRPTRRTSLEDPMNRTFGGPIDRGRVLPAVLAAGLAAALAGCGAGSRASSTPARSQVRPVVIADSFPAPACAGQPAARGEVWVEPRPAEGDTCNVVMPSAEIIAAMSRPRPAPPTPPLAPEDTAAAPVAAPCATSPSVSVMVFPTATADSAAHPSRVISGPHSGMCSPRDLALGPRGELFVAAGGNTIAVHDREASGDAAPRRTLAAGTWGFGLGPDGYIYTATAGPAETDSGSVSVYGAGASGNTLPVRTIVGRRTLLRRPRGIAVDRDGLVYAAATERNAIVVHAPDADGELAPLRVIAGPATRLARPVAVAFDRRGNLYVANGGFAGTDDDRPSVTVYAPGVSGDVAPLRVLEAEHPRGYPAPYPPPAGQPWLYRPVALAVEAHDTLYVAGESSVFVYAPGASAKAAPVRWLSGPGSGVYATRAIGLDRHGAIYVLREEGKTVAVYPPGARDSTGPVRTIAGPHTGLASAFALAIDPHDTLYVTTGDSVALFAALATGDARPARTIGGGRTGISAAMGVALDKRGRVYVANGPLPKGQGAIRVYPPRAAGLAAPVRTLTGPATRLFQPTDVAFDSRGNLYVVSAGSQGAGLVTVYDRTARGNTAPSRVLTGPTTYLRRPIRMAFGRGDTLYVLNAFSWWKYGTDYVSVTVYAPGASGDAAPVRIINVTTGRSGAGRRLGLNWPEDIAVGDDGSVYVSNYYPNPVVAVYPRGADGDAAPVRVIGGRGTPVTGPSGLALDEQGRLYVSNIPEPAGFTLAPPEPHPSPILAIRGEGEGR
jgi:sugar lactone lactonase YvrE